MDGCCILDSLDSHCLFVLVADSPIAIALLLYYYINRRNYPNFLNLFGQLLYIPLCFAYLVPASRSTTTRGAAPNDNSNNNNTRFSLSQWWPRRKLMKRLAIMGALDCLATTIQTFAAVYLPGPLLILLPQAAIPVSLVLTVAWHNTNNSNSHDHAASTLSLPQYLGAATVLLGIAVALIPVLLGQRAPDYYCEAQNPMQDCTTCRTATKEEDCVGIGSSSLEEVVLVQQQATTTARWLLAQDSDLAFATPTVAAATNTSTMIPACEWLPFEESSKEKELLELAWSIALVASTVPMALSALYKQRAMTSVEERAAEQAVVAAAVSNDETAPPIPSPPPALYVSGWIAVFQFACSVAVAVPAGLVSSPLVRPLQVPANLWDGMFCYAGVGVVATGCHPDTACSDAALWVNVTVLCHVVYTLSMMFVLKYSDGPDFLFLGLTAIVPIGHLCFTLPLLPEPTALHKSDLAGLLVILAGLVLYRFSTVWPSTGSVEPAVLHHDNNDNNAFPPLDSPPRHRSPTPLLRKVAARRQEQEHRRSQSIGLTDRLLALDESHNDNWGEDEHHDEKRWVPPPHSVLGMGSLWPVQNQTSYTLLRREGTVTATARSEDV